LVKVRIALVAVVLVAVTTVAASAPPPVPDPVLPARLVSAVSGAGALAHVVELQRIADAHGGDRAVDSPGYDASVEYVVATLRAAGYDVLTPSTAVRRFVVDEELLTMDGAPVPVRALGFSPSTAAGGVTGPLALVPGDGCAPTAVPPGSVALVRRGTCTFADKVGNAANAGAAAVVLINESEEPVVGDSLHLGAAGTVPAVGVTRSDGEALAGRLGTTVTLVLATATERIETRSVLAQTRTGDPDEVVMAGAHLDSVPEGPGINDNGSGVAALLETAVQLGGSPPVANAVRFAFWGAEEVGILGSTSYVHELPASERARIAAYLNLDMIASPNTAYLVYDGDDSDREGAGPGPPGSATIERVLVDGLAAAGAPSPSGADFDGRSDFRPFLAAGIPSGGLFTGAEKLKTPEEAHRFGGAAGAPYDPCYHQACDRIDTIDRTALDRNTDAIAAAVARFALSTKELAAG
jgi:Zn-dependent M28 family amino/carboxypeptidase